MNLAIVGYGSIAKLHERVLDELAEETGSRLVAIADPEREHPDSHIYSFRTHEDLFASQEVDVDAVIIATPHSTHAHIARDALLARKDVFLEKPPTLQMKDLNDLERIAAAQGNVLFTGLHTRYRPEVGAAKKALEHEEVRSIHVRYAEDALRWHGDHASWVLDPAIAGGGALIDSGINAVSVITYILPSLEYRVLFCRKYHQENIRVETSVKVEFEFGNKGVGAIQMDWLYKGAEARQILVQTASLHYFLIDLVQGQLQKDGQVISGSQEGSRAEVDLALEYRSLFRDFFEHLRRRVSFVSKKELQFVLDAYAVATSA